MKNHAANDSLTAAPGHISVKLRGMAPRARRRSGISLTALAAVGVDFSRDVRQRFAQQANQPGFDPRQTEKYFDNQAEQETLSRPPVTLPTVGQPNTGGDTKPQFVLRGINVSGAQAIPHDRIAAVYQPYLGKKVSQADLAAIARRDQRSLPRRRLPSEPRHRAAAGHRRRSRPDPGDRRRHRASRAEGRRRRAVRREADARTGSGRAAVAPGNAGTPALPHQRPARAFGSPIPRWRRSAVRPAASASSSI